MMRPGRFGTSGTSCVLGQAPGRLRVAGATDVVGPNDTPWVLGVWRGCGRTLLSMPTESPLCDVCHQPIADQPRHEESGGFHHEACCEADEPEE